MKLEADFTNDGTDISELTKLVEYMFQGGAPPPPCF